jgi:hypothetical protein
MSYHTAYPNWDSQSVVCHLFLYSFICAATTASTWLSKFCTLQLSRVYYLSWELSWCRDSFLKGDLQFSNLYRFVHIKVPLKTFHPFYPPPFSPSVCSPYRIRRKTWITTWNVLYHTSLRHYAAFSLQVPSILSILLGLFTGPEMCTQKPLRVNSWSLVGKLFPPSKLRLCHAIARVSSQYMQGDSSGR